MRRPRAITVRVRLPFSWPWESLRFSGVGEVSKVWTEKDLDAYLVEALRRKGVEVEDGRENETTAQHAPRKRQGVNHADS